MSKQTIERLIDDLDGSEASETVPFGLDGITYSIDVNERHAQEVRNKLGPFIEVARKVRAERRGVTRGALRPAGDKERNASIRQWALSEGAELATRGRIAGAVQAAYEAKDGDALRAALGLELVQEEERPKRRRRGIEAEFSAR